MAQTVTLQLPDEMLQRCQRGATAARKLLEEFLVDRLMEALPPSADAVLSPLREELRVLESLDDEALWQMAQSQLSPARQRLYSRLLTKQSQETITAQEKNTLQALGDEARLLTLKKAHASLVLRWRGHHTHCRSTWPLGTGWLASSTRRPGNVISRVLLRKRVQQREGKAAATLSLTYPVVHWPLGGRRCQSPR